MTIRPAEPSDMKQVLERIRELAVFEKEPEAVVITEADLIRDGFSDPPLFQCLVAEEQDIVLGIALFYFRYSTWKGKTIHLEDLIVKASERGRGIGMALYREVIRRGKEEGVRRIEWAVLDWNTPAIQFYEKTGARVQPDWRVVQMDENGIATFLEKKG